mmetsp:Transcript_26177/g.31675  ORF Transcript_26177/g.31675 Transcript_26177/m.31675 type:complete len:156 (+) Transcript_26177:47-514(+)
MGGNTSKEQTSGTIAAYTFYGFGCRCKNEPTFVPGSPQNDCCGTSGTRVTFDDVPTQYESSIKNNLESHLDDAVDIAMESITWCSYVCLSQIDKTSETAANALNERWCSARNEVLRGAGLKCEARREVYGFGRSRVTYLVIRVYALQERTYPVES